MQDLNVINRQNNEAFKDAVTDARAKGKTVVLEKQGLHAVGFKAFDTLSEASTYAAAYLTAAPANNADVLGAL
jgi:hypothetical protein